MLVCKTIECNLEPQQMLETTNLAFIGRKVSTALFMIHFVLFFYIFTIQNSQKHTYTCSIILYEAVIILSKCPSK